MNEQSVSGRGQNWWDRWHLGLAQYIATASKDPSTKVGAVIVDRQRGAVSWGYNGFAREVEDLPERLNDRETKYLFTVHAEENAVLHAKRSVDGCTLYTWPFMPCAPCASRMKQAGIVRIVAPVNDNERWVKSFEKTRVVCAEAHIELVTLYYPTEPLIVDLGLTGCEGLCRGST